MRQALGKGIGALIPGTSSRRADPSGHAAEKQPSSPSLIPLASIVANPRQPRSEFDEDRLAELTASIRASGLLQPILVRSLPDGKYELIAGERRTRVARLAGLDSIPAVIRDATDHDSLALAIVENLQRADLGPLEEAAAFQSLMAEFGLTQEQVAVQVGRSRPAIANSIRLLQLPLEVRKSLAAGEISAGHARALLSVDSDVARTTLARQIIQRRMSVREAERAAEAVRSTQPPRKPPAEAPKTVDRDVRILENGLTKALGRRVHVRTGSRGRGEVVIEYYSDDDLASLADRLSGRPQRPDSA